jgi:plastocyanin
MKKIFIAILVCSILLFAGCVQQQTPERTTAKVSSDAGQASNSASVEISNFEFSPSTVTIAKGGSVTWTNMDSAGHAIAGGSFSSALLGKGESFSQTFSEAGTFDYHCSVHPSMTGKVVVQ